MELAAGQVLYEILRLLAVVAPIPAHLNGGFGLWMRANDGPSKMLAQFYGPALHLLSHVRMPGSKLQKADKQPSRLHINVDCQRRGV